MSQEKVNTEKKASVDSKKMLKELAEKKVKVRFSERLKLEILKDTKYYKKGQIINPHVTIGNELVKLKIAKKV
tara:strand:+ start:3197 stop:3415 length:219 start_codon:yes stop_codon:yes gene_type:complete